ncbi:MAG: xanthine dehydrogenase accessory protein XdhC [Steroidobacter sp.]
MSAAPLSHPQPSLQRSVATGTWLEPLGNWPAAAIRSLETNDTVVRVVIASVRGSSPREVGTSMLVERERILGTIGGGQLEWSAIVAARSLLNRTSCPVELQKLTLGPQLSQCCGGAVELWLERYSVADIPLLTVAAESQGPTFLVTAFAGGNVERRVLRHPALDLRGTRALLVEENGTTTLSERLDETQPPVWLYGAGHVGQALVRVLATLPMQLTWIDSRAELLPSDLPPSVHAVLAADPAATVDEAPPGTRFLIMTHSHPLDYALCKAVLERNDQSWIGVIGSKSKSVRFRSRLMRDGLSREQVERLTCPIGIDGVDSKLPAAIAVSVAAQLLQTLDASVRSHPQPHGCGNDDCQRCSLHSGTQR